jgi:hypothetical protein
MADGSLAQRLRNAVAAYNSASRAFALHAGSGDLTTEWYRDRLDEKRAAFLALVDEVADLEARLPEKGEPARCPECGSERRGAPSCGCGWHDGSPT